MGGLRYGFGSQISPPTTGGGGGTPSTAITGLSSRQVVFGSSVGGLAQIAGFQVDSTQGFIGIGTSAPGQLLHIHSASTLTMAIAVNGSSLGQTILQAQNDLAAAVQLRMTGSTFAGTFGQATTNAAVISLVGGSQLAIGTTGTAPITLVVNNTEFVRLNSSGHMGVGTTAPTAVLEVMGGNTTAVGVLKLSTASGAAPGIQFDQPDSSRWRLRNISASKEFALEFGLGLIFQTGPTQKIGFYGSTGSTQPAAYTTAAITTGRTFPTTQSTVVVAAVSTAQYVALVNAFNQLLGVTLTMAHDLGVSGNGLNILR